ncbi:MAG: alkaline phosphatase family protein [Candidatus Aminicenantes bacterium]
MAKINRRDFLKMSLSAGPALMIGSSGAVTHVYGKSATSKKMIILGFDGVDPHLLEVWMDQGKLPAFDLLRKTGSFSRLRTSIPPQSPVAWSNFITGMNPGGHGIYDFMHRNPENYLPEFSASVTTEASRIISIGDYQIPLSGGTVEQARRGKAFWQILEEYDIPATIFKIPANYPPSPTKQKTLAGMGTPDMLGSYGICNYYTTRPKDIDEDIGGARVHEVYIIGHQVQAKIAGPPNSFKKNNPETEVDFKVHIDPVNPVAKISYQDQEFILKEGEWSGWKRIKFNLIPTQSVSGICYFYLKEVRPEFKLYVSPVNIDPADPALPISTPDSYSRRLAEKFGPFFTKGLPADTNALTFGLLDDQEFLHQDDMVFRERAAMFDYEFSRFNSGLLFYYVSSTDQRQHMFWRHIDKQNPLYDPAQAKHYKDAIYHIYRDVDRILDKVLHKADKDTIIMVLSDHGFSPFRREFNANTWLKENGYHSLINEKRQGDASLFMNTDWTHTKAYAMGLNGLYINQSGREAEGTVSPGPEKDNLVHEIARKLESYRDPETGEQVVLRAFPASQVYTGGEKHNAPDIILGFNNGYRISWASPQGRLSRDIVQDNMDKWSGDHCMAPEVIPGVLLTNRKLTSHSPALYDLTPTILKAFGITPPPEMIGKPVF